MSYCEITKKYFPASEMQKVMIDGEYKLVSPVLVTKECEECGERFLLEDVKQVYKDGNLVWVCEDCMCYYCTCEDCGSIYHEDEVRNVNGYMVCDYCLDEHYVICECCDEYCPRDESYETEDGDYICESCYDSSYVLCTRCGTAVYCDNAYYADDDEGRYDPYCSRCFERLDSVIHDYGYKPIPHFKKTEDEIIQHEYFGMEIEVEGDKSLAKEFLGYFDKDQIYLKRDGSVDGFEIVTMPMSRKYFYEKFVPQLDNGMGFLRRNGFRGHNRAGIHIHVSSEIISLDDFKKLVCLLYPEQETVYKKWLAITQRHDDKMREWSTMKLDGNKQCARKKKKEIAERIETHKQTDTKRKPATYCTRYTALNVQNEDTIEFRIFNSNIRTERIIKNMQVVFSLLDFTGTDKLPTFNNYMNFVKEHKEDYREYWEFLNEKGIVPSEETKQKVKHIVEALRAIDNNVVDYNSAIETLRAISPNGSTEIDDNDEVTGGVQCA